MWAKGVVSGILPPTSNVSADQYTKASMHEGVLAGN